MIKLQNLEWYFYHGALLPKVPPHFNVVLSKKEQKYLLKKSKAFFLRYTNEWDRERSDFWYVVKDEKEGLETYKSKIRNQIKKGLKNCEVLKVSQKEIVKDGYEVYLSAMKNYNTDLSIISKEQFQNSKTDDKNYDIWAVYEKRTGKMIAYSSNKIENRSCNYTEIKLHPKYLSLYPSYALFYEMNHYYLEEKGYMYVHDGTRSISHDTNIHTFLIDKFKFRKAFVKLNVIYRWDVKLFVVLLYPLRKFISKVSHPIFKKISVVLKQEEIRRSFE